MSKHRWMLLIVALVLAGPSAAVADHDRDGVIRFATLPKPGPGFPEGLAADDAGNVYVATFDFTVPNVIHVFGPHGRLRFTVPLPGVVPLGLAFDPHGNLYVADFGNGKVLKFAHPLKDNLTPVQVFDVCGGAGAGCGLNAIDFDKEGNLYVSDSFGGNVFKIDLPGGTVSSFLSHDLLKPGSHGFPPFGANGLAFDATGENLYIANTADDRILRYELATKELSIFAESINGADGIVFAAGKLWVAANQQDEVVALNGKGRVVARIGSFEGIGPKGAPRGLLFPASLVVSRGSLFVTNLALFLTPAEGDEPEEDVSTYTVSRIPLH